MRDYVKELMAAWTEKGEQAAYVIGSQLLKELRQDIAHLEKQELAIEALGVVLRDHPEVDTAEDPSYVPPELDTIEPSERPRLIIEAAQKAFHEREISPWTTTGLSQVKSQEVLDQLRKQGLDLGVQQPLAVIGTVLSSANGFHKIARNTFQVRERKALPAYDETDDLPF